MIESSGSESSPINWGDEALTRRTSDAEEKAKYGGLEVSEAQRLRHLEEENRKLKQLVAEQALDIVGYKAVLSKKW